MATSKTSLWNAAWTGPVVCVLVMAAVFLALWWATREMDSSGPSGEEAETFMADATQTDEFGTSNTYAIANHRAMPDRKVSRTATTGDDRPTQLCDLREEIRHLQKQMLDAQPGAMIRVPDNKDNGGPDPDPKTDFTKYGLTFVWAQSASQSNDGASAAVSADLRVYVYYTYELGGQTYADIKPLTFTANVSGNRQFVPIGCDVLDRKRAASARVVRLLVEYKDPAQATCFLGIEKVMVVTFNSDKRTDDVATVKPTALAVGGKRIRYGVLQVDPVVLASNQAIERHCDAGNPLELPHAQAILGDVVYGGYRVPYPSNATKTYRLRLRFDGESSGPVDLWCVQMDPDQDKTNKMLAANADRYGLAKYRDTGFKNVPSFKDEAQQATTIVHETFRQENVTQIRLPRVHRDGVYECTFACAEPRVTASTSKTLFIVDKDAPKVRHLEVLPEHTPRETVSTSGGLDSVLVHKERGLNPMGEDGIVEVPTTEFTRRRGATTLCTDYIIDGDASIVRLNQDPAYTQGDTPPKPVCSIPFDQAPLVVNDGWMYTGTLRLPLVHPMADDNRLLRLTIRTTTNATFEFSISRLGAYLHLNDQPVAATKMKLTANVVRFAIYVHQNTFGISLNHQRPFASGTSPKLHELYYSAGKALVKGEAGTLTHLASYPAITSLALKVDPQATIRSRFVSAIAYAPAKSDIARIRPDENEVRMARPVCVWAYDKTRDAGPSGADRMMERDLSADVTDSVSWEAELSGAQLTEAITAITGNTPQTPKTLKAVYPDGEAKRERECTLVSMRAGREADRTTNLVTVFLASTSDQFARQFEVQVRFDGCQKGPFRKRAPTYKLCDQTLFNAPATSIGKQNAPRVLLKCTLHRLRVRVCLFVKFGNQAPKLVESFVHEVSPDFDLASKLAAFPHIDIDRTKVTRFTCVDRATSTRCNPYVTKPDTKGGQAACTLDPMSGTAMGNPNVRITDFPCTTTIDDALDNRYGDRKCAQYSLASEVAGSGDDAVEACVRKGQEAFPNGSVTYVKGGRQSSSGCTNNCFYGDGPCELKYTGNGEVVNTAFTFHNNCDVVEQVGRRLGGGA